MAKTMGWLRPEHNLLLAIISNYDLPGMSIIKLTTIVEKPVNAAGA